MRPQTLQGCYTIALFATAVPAAVWGGVESLGSRPAVSWAAVACLVLALVVTEVVTVEVARPGRTSQNMAISGAFAMALAFVAPLYVPLLATSAALVADGARRRVALRSLAFNVAAYAAIILVLRGVFAGLTDQAFASPGHIPPSALPAMAAAGMAYYVVNAVLTACFFALPDGTPVRTVAWHLVSTHSASIVFELSLVPFAVLAAAYSPVLLALLFVPVGVAVRVTRLAAQQERAAWHDPITGLPNLQLLRQMYLSRREEAEPGAERLAVLLVDLDGLKGVQQVLGDDAVILLLTETARRLEANVRAGDVVARRTDDFAILAPLEAPDAAADLEALATRLLRCLNEPFYLDDVRVDVQATIGAVVTDTAEEEPEVLVRRAGLALQAARADAPGTLRVYTAGLDADGVSTHEQLSLLGELREAIESGQLELHYQPKVDVLDGTVRGVEALVRWRHPERGMIFPDKFLPLAEHTGLIEPLTWVVLDKAVAQAKAWQERGWALGVAVNFAAGQIVRDDTVERILGTVAEHQLDPRYLTVEITEGTLLGDTSKALRVLEKLRWFGVRISIDDYGTGHSSLSYLHQLQPDELKIDRSFVKDLATDNAGAAPAIVESTVDLARRLGVKVVAEGAEDQATVDILRSLGADLIQGYHYSRPLPAAALTAWLEEQPVAMADTQQQAAPGLPLARRG